MTSSTNSYGDLASGQQMNGDSSNSATPYNVPCEYNQNHNAVMGEGRERGREVGGFGRLIFNPT